ncbi:AraC family transcriptional regulator [Leuconostoc suionicum]|uniref:AraC family transcriptional regulator n=1 Tax=Leuconostoc suionicum TaxID=1511761 RepID=UPI00233ED16B|nr:AraC family transcriptional regulator [Leuconostoc suionicum]MDC2805022.1 AraC family transcriptional regulator [Leuconostoc suionicum]MDC2822534.1 AraC family transcriptional regulator [Leuconostoc suionicum]
MTINYSRSLVNQSLIIKRCTHEIQTARYQYHDFLSIGIVEGGSCIANVDKVRHIKKNTLVIIPSQLVHWCQPMDIVNWRYTMLYIASNALEFQFNQPMTIKLTSRQMQQVKMIMDSAIYELDILTKIINVLDNEEISSFRTVNLAENMETRRFESVQRYISNNFHSERNVETLANISGLSKYYFTRLFKETFHISPAKYLMNYRMNRAVKDLLDNTNLSMSEIAHQNGFFDESHFDKLFKQYHGVSPKKYQLQLS